VEIPGHKKLETKEWEVDVKEVQKRRRPARIKKKKKKNVPGGGGKNPNGPQQGLGGKKLAVKGGQKPKIIKAVGKTGVVPILEPKTGKTTPQWKSTRRRGSQTKAGRDLRTVLNAGSQKNEAKGIY